MRALVLSGGGARGAFQVGVIRALVEYGVRWQVMAGVSVGAINAAHMAHYQPATQRAGAMTLEAFWNEIKGNESIYTGRPFGFLSALTAPSLNDTAPLRKLIASGMNADVLKESGVKLRIGAVSLTSGRYRAVDETVDNLVDWVMASSAFPVAFPPVKIDGDLWIDGGVRNVTPIEDIANIEGIDEIDIVLTSPVSGDAGIWNPKGQNALSIAQRAASLLADEVYLGDLHHVNHIKTNIWAPPGPWHDDALDFDAKKIEYRIGLGKGVVEAKLKKAKP